MSTSSLQAADQQDSHAVLEGQDADGDLIERRSKIRSRWSKGQGSWSTPKAANVEPVGGGSGGGEEIGAGPAMPALSQDAEGTTDGDLEDDIMTELGQAGGSEDGEESDKPVPIVSGTLVVFSVPGIFACADRLLRIVDIRVRPAQMSVRFHLH